MKIEIGQKAPSFILNDVDKKMVSLEDFRGKNVVLFFFPMAWTSTCTREMCTVQEEHKQYEDLNAAVVGISVDTLFALRHYQKDYHLDNVILLSDFDKETIRAYDIVIENFAFGYHGVSKRATFVIDKEGIVRFAEVLEDAGKFPDMDAVKRTLKGLN